MALPNLVYRTSLFPCPAYRKASWALRTDLATSGVQVTVELLALRTIGPARPNWHRSSTWNSMRDGSRSWRCCVNASAHPGTVRLQCEASTRSTLRRTDGHPCRRAGLLPGGSGHEQQNEHHDAARVELLVERAAIARVKLMWAKLPSNPTRRVAGRPLPRGARRHEMADRSRRRIERILPRLVCGRQTSPHSIRRVQCLDGPGDALGQVTTWLGKGANILLFRPPGGGRAISRPPSASLGRERRRVLFARTTICATMQVARESWRSKAPRELDRYDC